MARRPPGGVTVWILGDQLTPDHAALAGLDRQRGRVLLIESLARARQRPYHKQKLVLLWSAMRHFAAALRARGYTVDYHAWEPTYEAALAAHVTAHRPSRVRLMEPAEHGAATRLAALCQRQGVAVETLPNTMFLSDRAAFARAARGKQTLLLEAFYRRMRRSTGLLMDGDAPAGGRWNYDALNRERPPAGHTFPAVPQVPPDAETRAVMAFVAREFPNHFGDLDDFAWPVTRADAAAFAADFLDRRLDGFGPYEDAIVAGERTLYHSLLSPLLNLGLVDPLDVCRQAEARYRRGLARLNSVEGFIRQVLGWREFVYQVYHLRMPAYASLNHLGADLPLPEFYWTADTDMFCVADAVRAVRTHAINHHIQRLMITGNFALLAGLDPQAVTAWYWLAYADAYEWVVTPNVLGLSLYADGGLLATKPYAASANYVNRMSDCCRHCRYDWRQSTGDRGCPFNALYWDFLVRHAERFARNPRLNLVMGTLRRRDPTELAAIRARARTIRDALRHGERV